jgi:hypothetical protein
MRGFIALLVVLALLVLGAAHHISTPEELLDELGEIPGINVTQINETAYMVLGSVQSSDADDLLNHHSKLLGINVTQINETAYLLVLQPAGNTSAAPSGSLAT